MTLWQDQPPQTRRQAREQERLQAPAETAPASSRRAATVEPTPAGEIPAVTTPFVFASGRDTAATEGQTAPAPFGEPSAPPARPNLPAYGASFDAILTQEPEQTQPDAQPSQQSPLFRDMPATDAVEPVTTPVALVPASELPTTPPVTTQPVGDSDWVPERTLTRRELRAMLQAEEANQFAGGREGVEEQSIPVTPAFTPAARAGRNASDRRSTCGPVCAEPAASRARRRSRGVRIRPPDRRAARRSVSVAVRTADAYGR